jgi:hypothetical protein
MDKDKPARVPIADAPDKGPGSKAITDPAVPPARLAPLTKADETSSKAETDADAPGAAVGSSSAALPPLVAAKIARGDQPDKADLADVDAGSAPTKAGGRTKPEPNVGLRATPPSSQPTTNSIGSNRVETVEAQSIPLSTQSMTSRDQERVMATKSDTKAFAADVRERASAAFQKGSALLGEAGDLTKANLAAASEAGKIWGRGLQQLGTDCAVDGRAMFDTVSAEVKELAAAKSPFDFFKLQGEFLRRNFATAIELGWKNGDAIVKLAQEASAPLTRQAKAAIDTVRNAA